MTTTWGILTIGGSPVQLPADIPVCKLSIQSAPGNTGNIKIGAAGLTSDNATGGIFLAPSATTNADSSKAPGGFWSVESQEDSNTIHTGQYYIHGTHTGDVAMWETHQS